MLNPRGLRIDAPDDSGDIVIVGVVRRPRGADHIIDAGLYGGVVSRCATENSAGASRRNRWLDTVQQYQEVL